MRAMLQRSLPEIDISPNCDDPYSCAFHGHCWAHIPENSVFDFRGPGRPNAFELYRQGTVRMEDVPADALGWRQKLQLDGLLYQKNYIDKKLSKLSSILSGFPSASWILKPPTWFQFRCSTA